MNERIQKIKSRHAEATPGPWTHSRWAHGYVVTDDDKFDVVASVVEYRENGTIESKFGGEKSLANREFIARAPEDIAYLLAEVERLQTALYTHQSYDKTASELYEENLILTTALKWYATKENYDPVHLETSERIPIDADEGRRARAALAKVEGVKE